MNKIFYWLVCIFLGLCVIAVLSLGTGWYFMKRSLPDYDATYSINGTLGDIQIVRDAYAVPHIFADQNADVYFGLGFAHAQDRLWQMLLQRRAAQGRLSELFGRRTIQLDRLLRRLDIYNLSRDSVAYQSESAQTALTAYADGVNAWLRIVHDDALGRGAPEMFVFPAEITPWMPHDSLALMRMMAVEFTSQLRDEILNVKAAILLGSDRWRDLATDGMDSNFDPLPDLAWLGEDNKTAIRQNPAPDTLHPFATLTTGGASNVWAVAGHRARGKKPLFANDPHLMLSAPSVWMLAGLQFADRQMIGATLPGVPLILSGRSKKLAWGVTVSYVDDLDVYIERVNPKDESEYLTPNGYAPFRTEQASIEIHGSPPEQITMRWTQNGPIISNKDGFHVDDITPEEHVVSMNWVALRSDDRSFTAALGVMHSDSVDEARVAGADYRSPSLNLALADENDIAMQLIGRVPKRDARHTTQGRWPSQGWLPQNRWLGEFDYSDNLFIKNPKNGLIANTNNQTTSQPFPNHLSYAWGDTQRIRRLIDLMGGREIHTRSSFVETQLDSVSEAARGLLPLIAKELWFSTTIAEPNTPEALRQRAIDLLAEWNGEMTPHQPEPLIFAAWTRHLQKRLLSDELGVLSATLAVLRPVFIERVFRNIDGAGVWCDIIQSESVETCGDIARHSLDEALMELRQLLGDDVGAWRWGQVHQAHQDHQVLGRGFLGWFFNIRQEVAGGDNTLQNASLMSNGATPYASNHAAGYRMVVDFADLESSLYIISTGQSGHFLSPHYDDLSQIWRRGEYIPMVLDPNLVRTNARGVTDLVPKLEGAE